ncbi:MAG: tail fiber protein [Candidatus Omnitrophica bacterium]|nr:tail fiber protein [Candidatus Omnitrophota bacterium]
MGIKNKGFSLLELSMVFMLMAVIGGAVIPNFLKSVHIEAAKKTALEMSQLEEAARVYYIKKNSWPDTLKTLQDAEFLDEKWDGQNPFGSAYVFSINGSVFTVKTEMPQDMTTVTAALLPMSSANGKEVSSDVTIPGADSQGMPAGAIMPWTSVTPPSGWLICDGRSVLRTDYPALFAVIDVRYGSGDGTTTFNVPDLRGKFLAGLDATQTEFNSIGKAGGSTTIDISHTHAISRGGYMSHNRTGDSVGDGYYSVGYIAITTPNWDWGGASGFGLDSDINTANVVNPLRTILNPYSTVNWIIKT